MGNTSLLWNQCTHKSHMHQIQDCLKIQICQRRKKKQLHVFLFNTEMFYQCLYVLQYRSINVLLWYFFAHAGGFSIGFRLCGAWSGPCLIAANKLSNCKNRVRGDAHKTLIPKALSWGSRGFNATLVEHLPYRMQGPETSSLEIYPDHCSRYTIRYA